MLILGNTEGIYLREQTLSSFSQKMPLKSCQLHLDACCMLHAARSLQQDAERRKRAAFARMFIHRVRKGISLREQTLTFLTRKCHLKVARRI